MRTLRLPLGVDIGTSRVRVAYAERDRAGTRLLAVATRDVEAGLEDDALAAILDELRRETGARVRSVAIALAPPDAAIKFVRFPKMGWGERRRAAAFEAERFAGWDVAAVGTRVRVHAVDRAHGLHAVGAVREPVLSARVRLLQRAGFRVAGADYTAFAWRRAFPSADAVLDIGTRRSVLYGYADAGPAAIELANGGEAITEAIGRALSIERRLAEKRKRILGTAGAGEEARADFTGRAAAAVAKLREKMPVRRIALAGNGARLPGLAADLETATGAIVELTVSDVLRGGAYPEDVVRAAAPDWSLAAALATWGAAT